ncbi:MAG: GDP-mannose 4,6-dehydratase [Clostridia bacterium]|nr:GDP-mannose 4,6-dehydratase [Clostridia bacterium]
MRALITGSEGFVGKYLRAELEANGYEVTGLDLVPGEKTVTVNLLEPEAVDALLAELQPDTVFHLAGQADVGRSWKIPAKTVEINVVAAVNLMEALRKRCPESTLVLVGSSDEYGNLREAGVSVSEETPVNPMTPYAISKIAQEQMGKAYARAYGMKICMTRSFNHGGAGQKPGFMIPDFASGIVRVERGEAEAVSVGNLASRRDFTHVEDVVRAYRLIAEKGRAGEVYNVGSGETHSAQEVLDRLIAMASCPVPVRQDPARMRPSDTPVICCDRSKLTRDTGWEPRLGLERILADTLAYYRGVVSGQ